jgi:membrane protease YdiL (CAAX protease family)
LEGLPEQPRFGRAELAAILLGAVYLLGPWRNIFTDIAAFGLGLMVIRWHGLGLAPPPASPATQRRILFAIGSGTAILLATLLAYARVEGVAISWVAFVVTGAIYLPFAWLQQDITQRYLVARLGASLAPRSATRAALVGGVIFGLCHLPFPGLLGPTLIAGVVWACVFLHSGRVWPIVVSHAVLGAGYFLTVLQRDPFRDLGLAAFGG